MMTTPVCVSRFTPAIRLTATLFGIQVEIPLHSNGFPTSAAPTCGELTGLTLHMFMPLRVWANRKRSETSHAPMSSPGART